jgi:glyoxylase-like metal-dependent hydrolase (beta-lactamase superfamily II)
MIFKQITVGKMANYCYIFADSETKEGFVVDPAFDAEKILRIIKENGLNITRIVLTHHHYDHINATDSIKARTGATVVCHAETEKLAKGEINIDQLINDGDEFCYSPEFSVKIMHTPGHAPGSICLIVANKWLVTGDTLFIGDCGRADLPGGDPEILFNSLQKFKALPENLIVCPGHNYGPEPTRKLAIEKTNNPTLTATSIKEFLSN